MRSSTWAAGHFDTKNAGMIESWQISSGFFLHFDSWMKPVTRSDRFLQLSTQRSLMSIIGKFLAEVRQKLLARRIHQEIKHCIFQQLVGDKKCGYPFDS